MDFTRKNRPLRPPLVSHQDPEPLDREVEEYLRNLNLDGYSLLPGQTAPEPMIGIDAKLLKERLEKNEELKARLLRDIAATWRCVKCKRETPGRNVRVRVVGGVWETMQGVLTLIGGEERLVCPDTKCGGEVVKARDPYRARHV